MVRGRPGDSDRHRRNVMRLVTKTALILALFGLFLRTVEAQDTSSSSSAQALFERGFYLQVHEHDLAGAAALFEKVAADASARDDLRSQARTRLAGIREDLASVRFAALM